MTTSAVATFCVSVKEPGHHLCHEQHCHTAMASNWPHQSRGAAIHIQCLHPAPNLQDLMHMQVTTSDKSRMYLGTRNIIRQAIFYVLKLCIFCSPMLVLGFHNSNQSHWHSSTTIFPTIPYELFQLYPGLQSV